MKQRKNSSDFGSMTIKELKKEARVMDDQINNTECFSSSDYSRYNKICGELVKRGWGVEIKSRIAFYKL